MVKDLKIGDLGTFSGRNDKKVKIIKINDKTVTFLIIDENKIKYIYTDDFKKKFTPEKELKTILKQNPENKEFFREIELTKEDKVQLDKIKNLLKKEKEQKLSKPTYSIVGVYSTDKPGRGIEEDEDLTKKNLLGYRIRYNKSPEMYFGYVSFGVDDLEAAKKQLQYSNDKAEKEKEFKKIRDAENKVKREQNLIIEKEKLEAANKEIIKKPAYLMTLSEYQDKVIPILNEYQKFLRKNNEYLQSAGYEGIYKYTYPELEEDFKNKTIKGERFAIRKYQENPLEQFKAAHYPSDEIVETNKSFKKKLLNFFSEKELFSILSKDELKSNKRAVKRAIDDETYKKLLESGELSEFELETIAKSVDVSIPKKVFSAENVKAKEMREKFGKLLSDLPTISKEKLEELIELIKVDFKPLEEEVFIKEKEKYTNKFKELESKDKVYTETLDSTIRIWQDIFSYEKVKYERIATGTFRRSVYTRQEEEIFVEKGYVTDLKLKSDWETTFDKFLKDYIDTLKYSFIDAIIKNFIRITKPIKEIEKIYIRRGDKGFEGIYRFKFNDGSYFDFKAEAIRAGGYNIQILHLRYITNFENITLADGTKVKGYSNVIENFSIKKMQNGGLTSHDVINKTDMYKDILKKPSNLLKISQMHQVPIEFLQVQLVKGMKVELEHTNRHSVAKIIALHHLEEDPRYYIKLEKVEGHSMAHGGETIAGFPKDYHELNMNFLKIFNEYGFINSEKYGNNTYENKSGDIIIWWPKTNHSEGQLKLIFNKTYTNFDREVLYNFNKKHINYPIYYEHYFGKWVFFVYLSGGKESNYNTKALIKLFDEFNLPKGERIGKLSFTPYYANGGMTHDNQDVKDLEYHVKSKKSKSKKLEDGGEIDPDDKSIKSAMTHKAGAAGGLLVGNRHSEGGIKAINKSTNSPIEMEGGEVVITRNAVSDNKKREFEGKMMTNREILSKINESGGGVSFASGGDVPSSCKCSGKAYKYGGKTLSDYDIIESMNSNIEE